MTNAPDDNWFAIRSIYLFGKKKDGTNVFEERGVVFSANTDEDAFAKARREADEYAGFHKLARVRQ